MVMENPMAEMINGVKVPFIPIVDKHQESKGLPKSGKNKFDSIFQRELEKIKFSSHAEKRMETRNINLTQSDLDRLNGAIKKAEMKGSRDSLVMMDNNAFVVSVDNKTVVTAVQMEEAKEKVFTNIDSVVFAQ